MSKYIYVRKFKVVNILNLKFCELFFNFQTGSHKLLTSVVAFNGKFTIVNVIVNSISIFCGHLVKWHPASLNVSVKKSVSYKKWRHA
ncbi:hypothetical protein T03_16126 [Trichinella britovi]|uniref:Uncharacterized protein n=1 Tax=Trichinella britovi TaxID=45882 RepID=A0A0V1D0X2_TRIBR|nr:hypothetical protein T03_16126 [Trichinella britovi]